MDQEFGGAWTLIKLEVLSKYLDFYTTALKKKFKLCYIDGFAGSGEINIRECGKIPGSAIRALDYHFDKYIFVEKDSDYIELLGKRISAHPSGNKTFIFQGDCNSHLKQISSYTWLSNGWRGVIFLDPFSLELKWKSLEEISKTKAFDVWYLFPLMALNRLLRRDKNIPSCHRSIIGNLLGTDDWEKEIYRLSPQISLFGDEFEKNTIDVIKQYILQRLLSLFPAVSPNPLILRSVQTKTPLFLLCFATCNPTDKAKRLALKGANYILTHS